MTLIQAAVFPDSMTGVAGATPVTGEVIGQGATLRGTLVVTEDLSSVTEGYAPVENPRAVEIGQQDPHRTT